MRTRTRIPSDHVGQPCGCQECRDADVAREPQRRVPTETGVRWIHGSELRRWLDARAAFTQSARAAVGDRGRHAAGFEPLVRREGLR